MDYNYARILLAVIEPICSPNWVFFFIIWFLVGAYFEKDGLGD